MDTSNIKTKLKDPRIIMCFVATVLLFFKWSTYVVSSSYMDYAESSASMTNLGFQFLMLSVLGYITMAFPVVAIIGELIEHESVKKPFFYIGGSLASLLGIIVTALKMAGIVGSSNIDYGGYGHVKGETRFEIFFWLEILIFVGIIVVSVMREYGVTGSTIREEGVKSVISDVTGKMTNGIAELKKNAAELRNADKAGQNGRTCPSCGNTVAFGKKFCSKCGHKMEDEGPSLAENIKGRVSKVGKSGVTVAEYISSLKQVKCEACGSMVSSTSKFCPGCGKEVVIMITPDTCPACGEKITKGNTFCSRCGAEVKKKKLIKNCPNCGADLIFGKNFCPECGKSIEEA
ncbi:MAG: zinc ribbon domain-containing protein [Lachnospiraceae bacterium]|nr:zinc ribbon domain-containing protein [Lachnospiraceae bacterium]